MEVLKHKQTKCDIMFVCIPYGLTCCHGFFYVAEAHTRDYDQYAVSIASRLKTINTHTLYRPTQCQHLAFQNMCIWLKGRQNKIRGFMFTDGIILLWLMREASKGNALSTAIGSPWRSRDIIFATSFKWRTLQETRLSDCEYKQRMFLLPLTKFRYPPSSS